ncbi:MAG TPA: phosphatase domain-containing protein [Longimicrobium sp.]|nr:phosphatase domain-containing protein [Longimicrobium sp.]
MADWQRRLAKLASRVDSRLDGQREKRGLGANRPVRIEAYRGFGRPDRLWVKARVLRGMPAPPAREGDSLWLNLSATLQRFESDEVPGAAVRVRYPGGEQVLTADREGYVECWVDPRPPLSGAAPWREVEMELVEPAGPAEPFHTGARVLVPPATARLGVISDLDDTVVRTDVASRVRMMKHVFFGNAHTRMPFPGVAAFYRALERGSGPFAHNPFFYVSSSPWNLYEVLAEFLELRKIPAGPLLLRDWGASSVDPGEGGHAGHKTRHISTILELYPTLPFILVGDSGQEDPEIYHRVVHDHPERILAVYIRNVSRRPERLEAIRELAAEVEKAGSTLILADDTLAAARHAASQGWIDPAALPEIGDVAHAEDHPRAEELKDENEAMSRGQQD